MENFKEKLVPLRVEYDDVIARAETAEAEIDNLKDRILSRDQEISFLEWKLQWTEQMVAEANERIKEVKLSMDAGVDPKVLQDEFLRRKEQTLRETTERLRQMSMKAELLERKAQSLEKEKALFKAKADDLIIKCKDAKEELENVQTSLESQ